MRKSYRVKKESEFQRVFETHNSVANHKFVVYQMEKPGQKHFRVGISVGKKIGNAVHRNWVKRRIRQTLLEVKPQLRSDVDFLVISGRWFINGRNKEKPSARFKAGTFVR